MALAAQRAYSDAVSWIRSARPRRVRRAAFAFRSWWWAMLAGLVLLGLIALVAPGGFGQSGSAFGLGWQAWALLAIVIAAGAAIIAKRSYAGWLLARGREPFVRPLHEEEAYEP